MRDDAVILLVEDRSDDVSLMLLAFEQAGIKNPVHIATDGQEAIQYLAGTDRFSDRRTFPLPQLVLLDLKMPKVDGFEVLRWTRAQTALAGLRVVVLTSSDEIRDVNKAYALGANSFLVKPRDFKGFVELARSILDDWFYWSAAPTLPPAHSPTAPSPGSAPRINNVHLRERQSRRFYAARGRWVDAREEALNFERVDLAQALAAAERLAPVEIVIGYNDPACELNVPV